MPRPAHKPVQTLHSGVSNDTALERGVDEQVLRIRQSRASFRIMIAVSHRAFDPARLAGRAYDPTGRQGDVRRD